MADVRVVDGTVGKGRREALAHLLPVLSTPEIWLRLLETAQWSWQHGVGPEVHIVKQT